MLLCHLASAADAVVLLQVLQLQHKQRALERQLKQHEAAASAAAAAMARQRSASSSPARKAAGTKAAAKGPRASQHGQLLQRRTGASSSSKPAAASAAVREPEGCPDSPHVWSDVTHSPDVGSSPHHSPKANSHQGLGSPSAAPAAGSMSAKQRPWPLMQQQRQRRGTAAMADAAQDDWDAAAAGSWPALCAELEGEVEALRAALLAKEQQVGDKGGAQLLVSCRISYARNC